MVYEFRCGRCGRRFDVYATLAEKEAGLAPACPRCGSTEVERVFGRVFLLRSGGESAPGAGSAGGEADGEAFSGGDDFDSGDGWEPGEEDLDGEGPGGWDGEDEPGDWDEGEAPDGPEAADEE